MCFVQEYGYILIVNHWQHNLLKELCFVLDGAAVDFNETFLIGFCQCSCEFGFADTLLTVKHQEGKNAVILRCVQVERKLTFDVRLANKIIECFVGHITVVRC